MCRHYVQILQLIGWSYKAAFWTKLKPKQKPWGKKANKGGTGVYLFMSHDFIRIPSKISKDSCEHWGRSSFGAWLHREVSK